MSNIDKRALREIAEAAVSAHERLSVMPPDDIFDISLAEGTQLDADITALNALNSAANPTTVLALLDELEAKDRRNAELNSTLERWAVDRAQSASEIDDAEKRIVAQSGIIASARKFISEYAGLGDVGAAEFIKIIDRAAAGKGE